MHRRVSEEIHRSGRQSMSVGKFNIPIYLFYSIPRRTISSSKYQVDDGHKYGVMTGNGMEEIKYVTSTCSLDVDPSKGPYGSAASGNGNMVQGSTNGQVQMNQNGQAPGSGGGNVIMLGNCSGSSGSGEEDSLSQQQQQHQVKTEDNSHSYVLPPFLH